MKKGLYRIQEIKKNLILYIQEKEQRQSQQSIDECWNEISKEIDARKRRKHLRLFIRISSVAAAVLLLFAVSSVVFNFNVKDGQKIADNLSENDINEVTLISGGEKIIASTDKPQIVHTKNGDIIIDNQKIAPKESKLQQDAASQQQNYLLVPAGKRTSLVFADGTKMYVNSRSKVIYPKVFDAQKREVYVEGEAYFEVAHNAKVPFVVKTADFEVEVHGTTFDVLSYKEMDNAVVTLVEGSVSVTNSKKESIKLKPSEYVQITSGEIGVPRYADTSVQTSWVMGYYSFDKTSLKDVTEIISFHFDKKIILDKKVQDLLLSGNLDVNLSLEEILQNLSSTLELHFYEQAGMIYVSKK